MLPILYQNHDFILYSYPLLMGIGWGIAYQIFFALIPTEKIPAKMHFLFWGIFASAWIGAKVFFLITQPEHRELVSNVSFWTGGGFVFYGGFIGAAIFCLIFHLLVLPLTLKHIWPMIPALTLGHGVGRLGCLLAGCCFGKETDMWWGIFMHGHYRHPTQLLEATGLILLGLYFLKSHAEKKILLIRYLIIYGVLRFGVEALRGDEVRGLWGPLSTSQWLSLLLISVGLFLKIKPIKSAPYKS
jgi:phosphatidylglycerol:prolipoprotein diacylglycerol transferase